MTHSQKEKPIIIAVVTDFERDTYEGIMASRTSRVSRKAKDVVGDIFRKAYQARFKVWKNGGYIKYNRDQKWTEYVSFKE